MKAFFVLVGCYQAYNRFQRNERAASPVLAYIGEHPMFYLVPFACS